jgi:hypothetical protein
MKNECQDDCCNITKEDVDAMSYKEKFVWMNILLKIEESENKMLRHYIEELERKKFPIRTKLRKVFKI